MSARQAASLAPTGKRGHGGPRSFIGLLLPPAQLFEAFVQLAHGLAEFFDLPLQSAIRMARALGTTRAGLSLFAQTALGLFEFLGEPIGRLVQSGRVQVLDCGSHVLNPAFVAFRAWLRWPGFAGRPRFGSAGKFAAFHPDLLLSHLFLFHKKS